MTKIILLRLFALSLPALSLPVVGLTACSSPTEVEDPEQRLIVTAFLTPGADTEVLLRRTLPPTRYYDGLEDTVAGALVQISTDGRTVTLEADAADPGLYRVGSDVLPVESGRSYQLQIQHEGQVLRAQTRVPTPSRVTRIVGDTITYRQSYGTLFGELAHPGEFYWDPSPDAAAYVIIVEAVDVRTLPVTADPLTGDLDSLLARRQRLGADADPDRLAELDAQIATLRAFFADNISLTDADGAQVPYLRDREQEEWDEIATKESWSEGKKWRERRQMLFADRKIDYWIPADSTRSDFWWLGVRFAGEYRVRLQAADRNYFDYFSTFFNGASGADGDKGPIFHVEGGTGVFGSYAEDRFTIIAERASEDAPLTIRLPDR